MTTRPSSSTDPAALFVDETTIAVAVLGKKDAAQWKTLVPSLERRGMPRPHPLIGLRYWPAIRAWFDNEYGLGEPVAAPDGKDDPTAWHARSKRRA